MSEVRKKEQQTKLKEGKMVKIEAENNEEISYCTIENIIEAKQFP